MRYFLNLRIAQKTYNLNFFPSFIRFIYIKLAILESCKNCKNLNLMQLHNDSIIVVLSVNSRNI